MRQARDATTKTLGDRAEDAALEHLLAHGLALVQRHYRIARGPGARAAEVDLVMREPDGTLVFVEVRARRDARFGGAAASVGRAKRERLLLAARHFLARQPVEPAVRFDVIAIDGGQLDWLRAAFDAG